MSDLRALLAGATPGPWRYSGPMETFGLVWAGKVPVAEVAGNSLPCEEQRANGMLLAYLRNNAERLAACEEFCALVEPWAERIQFAPGTPDDASTGQMMRQHLLDALARYRALQRAKARGVGR